MKLYNNIHSKITVVDPKNWSKFIYLLKKLSIKDEKYFIKISNFLKILQKFRLKLTDK